MSAEENKSLVRRWFEELVKGDLSVLDEIIAEDIVRHEVNTAEYKGRENYKHLVKTMLTAFSGAQLVIDDMIAEGDQIAVRYTLNCAHTGEFMGIAPTGKQITVSAIAIVRFAHGKAVESWANVDMLGLMQQMGAVSLPRQAVTAE